MKKTELIKNYKKEDYFLNSDNSIYIKKIGSLKIDEGLIYELIKYNDYFIMELIKNDEVIKTITIHTKNKRVVDYEGCYFLNKNVAKLLRKNKIIVPRECLR